ncbi:magnesium transporter MgtE N-terminal domain-containing protein [Candidatus Nitrospira allomarina]|jgi:magnesium transporter|uniref:CBS domain-containing protein n=1 Tax=Candidatus Nitrospira allomarina TaxID=3020900 RepID=A0AA96JXT4_9BACT|nr:CBS domain-containing protein [Candidatus Nitrospira allomarina]WNM59431.1 CBS domain-containing protein [Candidatus Nitrospira allomarina]
MNLTQQLRETFIQEHPLEAARYVEELPAQSAGEMLQTMEPQHIAAFLEYCLPGPTAEILKQYPPATSAIILSRLSSRSARAVLRQYDSSTQTSLLDQVDPAIGAHLRRSINLPDHTAGSLADPHVLTLPPDITVGKALQRVTQTVGQAIYYLYIIDHQTILRGVILMKELLGAEPTITVSSIMRQDVKAIPASANALDIVAHPAWAQYDSLPVIDQDRTFIGALRHRTLRQFLQSRSGEYQPAFLSDALLQLWEAYSLSGIGLMTALGESLGTSTPPTSPRKEQETP